MFYKHFQRKPRLIYRDDTGAEPPAASENVYLAQALYSFSC